MDNFQHIFSYEYLKDIIKKNEEKLLKKIKEENFEQELGLILDKMGFSEYANFRIITTQDQILEEKIGDLLNKIDSKISAL